MMKFIDIIAGARPNFIKIAPIIHSIIKDGNFSFRLIHTGQHYDKNMSQNFFNQLDIPEPDINLEVGSGSQANQTAKIMVKYEDILLNSPKPYLCLVVGDVNSTMACSIVAKKLNIKVAHVEAGIRSFDLTMPEEINRIITDSISDYFFTTSKHANKNLIDAGFDKKNIFFVGNTMIDTLNKQKSNFKKPDFFEKLNLAKDNYLVLTMHRPKNVDDIDKLEQFINCIVSNTNNLKVIFPIHPRTKSVLNNFKSKNLILVPPLPYLEFNYLVNNSKCVITDSGGITEETTVMNIPCITLRDNTERPETISEGTNILAGTNPENIISILKKLFLKQWKKGSIPELWDGYASERIIKTLNELLK